MAPASDNERFDVIDPATENKIASVASASVEDAKAAVDAANNAFAGWAAKKPRERAEVLRKAFDLIMRDAERLAKLITIENGKALADSRARGRLCRRILPLVRGRGRAQHRRGAAARRPRAHVSSCITSRRASPCW